MLIYLLKSRNTIFITREVYIINNLSVKALIKINIIKSKDIILNLLRDILIINSYKKLEVSITIYIR